MPKFPTTLPSRESVEAPLRVVSIGGGTGLSALLHGLKTMYDVHSTVKLGRPPVDITAVVTVSDDGGSSGRLRREFDVLPPGDIRNCLVALSEDEALLSRLFQLSLRAGRGLKGHSFGNLFLTALTHITGDFPDAVKECSDVLAIRGRIYPSTATNVVARSGAGGWPARAGRDANQQEPAPHRDRTPAASPLPSAAGNPGSHRAGRCHHVGPGFAIHQRDSQLLVEGIAEAIRRSPAVKAYFVNLMWQPGETTNFTASDHIAAIHRHAGGKLLDYAVVNTRDIQPGAAPPLCAASSRRLWRTTSTSIGAMGVNVVCGDLVQESGLVRHNPERHRSHRGRSLAREGRAGGKCRGKPAAH